jgi:hypothetical protein
VKIRRVYKSEDNHAKKDINFNECDADPVLSPSKEVGTPGTLRPCWRG